MITLDFSYFIVGGGAGAWGLYLSPDAGSAGFSTSTSKGGGFAAGFTATAGYFGGNGTCSLAGPSNFASGSIGPGAVSAGFSGGQLSSLQGGIAFGSTDIFFMGAAAGTSNTTLYPLWRR
jgi:hypothetical protein